MNIYSKTDKIVLGVKYPNNVCIDVPESQAQFLIDKEGFEIFKEKPKRNTFKKRNVGEM